VNDGSPPPAWRLPEGVDGPLWTYAHTPRLATSEDEYFEQAPLFAADSEALGARFRLPGRLIDLGCGAGRLSLQFAADGFEVVAVDLSTAMLRVVRAKAVRMSVRVACLRANLCRLDCLPDASFDYAISMFSTLGMIRGAPARRRALGQFARVLRPDGRLAIHAHNLWLNLRNPQGRRWLVEQGLLALSGRSDGGDRRMTYRGIPGMSVHLYRWGELRRDLEAAGLAIDEVVPIDEIHARPIRWPGLGHEVRAGGWIVFAGRGPRSVRAALDRPMGSY